MLKTINGSDYMLLVSGGIRNLEKNKTALNDLNVFPVPDGDTGTNMVMTLRFGYEAVQGKSGTLAEMSRTFSTAAVFGARGNSGVIVSQFFRGMADGFQGQETADPAQFVAALESGCKAAYASVAKPVEGTMLTVVREAAQAVRAALPLQSIDEVVEIFLREAHVSLKNTPQLLPVLKKAGVVDSGGSGIVCFFEGVRRHLAGEAIEETQSQPQQSQFVDLTGINKDTQFIYGYCVEALLQLTMETKKFDLEAFRKGLTGLGESVVATLEGDKVKLHVHPQKLSPVMAFCQQYGEFLTIKIENMTVQNLQQQRNAPQAEKFLYDADREKGEFSLVAVATNPQMQQTFFDMGADVVILSEIAPSAQDFVDAFALAGTDRILVFPNSANSILTSMQAASLYKQGKAIVLNSRSAAQCYAAMGMLDLEGSVEEAVESANDTISHLFQLCIYKAAKDVKFGTKRVTKDAYFSLCNNNILHVADTLESVAIQTVQSTLSKEDYSVVTLFYGSDIAQEYIEYLLEKLSESVEDAEFTAVSVGESTCSLTVLFE